MKNKIALIFILLTPILIVALSSIYFSMGLSPEGTKNEGVFFNDYFDVSGIEIKKGADQIVFEDGKWVMGVFITDIDKAASSLYLMRQLNVALNRDIFRVKRIAFYTDSVLAKPIQEAMEEYPRTEIFQDVQRTLFQLLQKNSSIDLEEFNPIFIIDPYGRVVMYFDPNLDPKKILKDLKVLI
ncbi:hypothetical protein N9833_00895 [Gammaproteobacteria bacterium]|nr:hypothetical protein [Gammaproteobacteria bacterium]MDB4252860.1 hypothetical protein [Gammaproteobacteria bacterium]MDC1491464.1 hypothetical protein [Gammaproteobacteria bacterium]